MALQTQEFKLRRRTPMSGRTLVSPVPDGIKARIETAESHLADAFKGVTTDGSVRPGLYTIQNTGKLDERHQDGCRFLPRLPRPSV